jgi:aspartate carbamoyltransferase regulatory subunit
MYYNESDQKWYRKSLISNDVKCINPDCESDNVNPAPHSSPDFLQDRVTVLMLCSNCETTWSEIYKFEKII